MRKLFVLLGVALMVSACGIKGALYLPTPPAMPSAKPSERLPATPTHPESPRKAD